jgi:hypothetical protein
MCTRPTAADRVDETATALLWPEVSEFRDSKVWRGWPGVVDPKVGLGHPLLVLDAFFGPSGCL